MDLCFNLRNTLQLTFFIEISQFSKNIAFKFHPFEPSTFIPWDHTDSFVQIVQSFSFGPSSLTPPGPSTLTWPARFRDWLIRAAHNPSQPSTSSSNGLKWTVFTVDAKALDSLDPNQTVNRIKVSGWGQLWMTLVAQPLITVILIKIFLNLVWSPVGSSMEPPKF